MLGSMPQEGFGADWKQLYQDNFSDLKNLDEHFFEKEIKKVVFG